MAENKKSFVAYCDWDKIFTMLTDEEAGKLIKHLLSYVNDRNPILKDRLLQMAFEPIKSQLKRDLIKYEEVRSKRSAAGRKGGKISGKTRSKKANEANASFDKQTETNEAVNDTVNVNVNDTVSTSVDSASDLEAYEFLKKESPQKMEAFEMQNKKSIPDFDVFVQNFNSKVITEELQMEPKILHARLMQLNANWDKNKNQKTNGKQSANSEPTISRQTVSEIEQNSRGW